MHTDDWSRTYAIGIHPYDAHTAIAVPTHNAYAHNATTAHNAIAARMTRMQQSKIATKLPFESRERYPSLKREQKTLHNYTRSKNFT